ncbi:MAG: hypothetical protein A2020_09125 [Lentisphaerae bacterium GWF2_45_14]|nr:MAG: hypothetical protein A2020_09125 [Lentisphaerae bacterium GWF2_45_14]
MSPEPTEFPSARGYWQSVASDYGKLIRITTSDFHYGPLVPGDSVLKLLPENLKGMKCLELGSGAAQNSIYLAKQGALCTAFDIAEAQIERASALAVAENVKLKLFLMPMEEMDPIALGKFDLIHSSYAISFTPSPEKVVKLCSEMLNPGGTLLFSTGHPLFSGEWLELEDEYGIFLKDYFAPVPDSRFAKDGSETVRSAYYPLSETARWISEAGMLIERLLEPPPLPIGGKADFPYSSKGWLSLYPKLSKVPVVAIFKCLNP